MLFTLTFAIVLCGIYFPGSAILDAIEAGKVSARKVGGLTFVKLGRFGFSYYVSRER